MKARMPQPAEVKRALIRVLCFYVIVYVFFCGFMWAFQRHMVFVPSHDVLAPEAYGLKDFSDLRLQSTDGIKLQAWYHKAQPGYPTLLYFHGNGGNLTFRVGYYSALAHTGFGVFALSYRGYGKSDGSPSEEGLYEDARSALHYLKNTLSVPYNQIILYGESLGTGVAVQMATEYPTAAIVLQSPYTSIERLASDRFYWIPVSFLLKDRFDSLSKIGRIHEPLLEFHGEQDVVVPVQYGRTLFEHAPEPKEIVYFPKGGHVDLDEGIRLKSLVSFCHTYGLIHTPAQQQLAQ